MTMITFTDVAPATDWWHVAPSPASTEVDRRWSRQRVATWAVVDGYVRPLVADRIDDGTPTGSPVLAPAGPGYVIHDADLWDCTCQRPERGTLADTDWCHRCTGIVR